MHMYLTPGFGQANCMFVCSNTEDLLFFVTQPLCLVTEAKNKNKKPSLKLANKS